MLLAKTDLCFRGLPQSNLFFFFPTSCLVSIHPNQNPKKCTGWWYRFRFVHQVGRWWQLVKYKGCTKHKKIICRTRGFWQIFATRQMHKSEVWENVCVCVHALFSAHLCSPKDSTMGMIAFDLLHEPTSPLNCFWIVFICHSLKRGQDYQDASW